MSSDKPFLQYCPNTPSFPTTLTGSYTIGGPSGACPPTLYLPMTWNGNGWSGSKGAVSIKLTSSGSPPTVSWTGLCGDTGQTSNPGNCSPLSFGGHCLVPTTSSGQSGTQYDTG
ncbi:MAG: hypothetical protein ACM3U2_20165, partial [Deltaproteobacteria bacterium]